MKTPIQQIRKRMQVTYANSPRDNFDPHQRAIGSYLWPTDDKDTPLKAQ